MSEYPEELVDRYAEALQEKVGNGVVYWPDLPDESKDVWRDDVRTIFSVMGFHQDKFVLAGRLHVRWVAATPWVEQ